MLFPSFSLRLLQLHGILLDRGKLKEQLGVLAGAAAGPDTAALGREGPGEDLDPHGGIGSGTTLKTQRRETCPFQKGITQFSPGVRPVPALVLLTLVLNVCFQTGKRREKHPVV